MPAAIQRATDGAHGNVFIVCSIEGFSSKVLNHRIIEQQIENRCVLWPETSACLLNQLNGIVHSIADVHKRLPSNPGCDVIAHFSGATVPTQVGRAHTSRGQIISDYGVYALRGARLAQEVQHHRSAADGRNGICDALPGNIRRRTMDRFE
jgi:hypothetical protein